MGDFDAKVTLELNGDPGVAVESYDITTGIFSQPSHFEINLETAELARELLARYPAGSTFLLKIDGHPQFDGFTDGYKTSRHGSGPRRFSFVGRDPLGELLVNDCDTEQVFTGKSTVQIIQHALDQVGLSKMSISVNNEASRRTRAGVPIVSSTEPIPTIIPGTRTKSRRGHLGDPWFTVISHDLAHSGLFLWYAPGGTFVLSRPNITQTPLYRLSRSFDGTADGNITGDNHSNTTTHRAFRWSAYGRTGGKRFGSVKSKGSFEDGEMFALGFNHRVKAFRDPLITSDDEAEFYARRQIAKTLREGYRLTYSVAGHTTPAFTGGRAVWTPDTMVSVDDAELGIYGSFWIESCRYHGNPTETGTEITLMRPTDLLLATH